MYPSRRVERGPSSDNSVISLERSLLYFENNQIYSHVFDLVENEALLVLDASCSCLGLQLYTYIDLTKGPGGTGWPRSEVLDLGPVIKSFFTLAHCTPVCELVFYSMNTIKLASVKQQLLRLQNTEKKGFVSIINFSANQPLLHARVTTFSFRRSSPSPLWHSC